MDVQEQTIFCNIPIKHGLGKRCRRINRGFPCLERKRNTVAETAYRDKGIRLPVGNTLWACPDFGTGLDGGAVGFGRKRGAETEIASRGLGIADVGEDVNVGGGVVAKSLVEFIAEVNDRKIVFGCSEGVCGD